MISATQAKEISNQFINSIEKITLMAEAAIKMAASYGEIYAKCTCPKEFSVQFKKYLEHNGYIVKDEYPEKTAPEIDTIMYRIYWA